MPDLHTGEGFTPQTAPTRAVWPRPFRETVTQTFIHNSGWQSPSLPARSPRALAEGMSRESLCFAGCPSARSTGSAGQSWPQPLLLTCCSREPAAAALLTLARCHGRALLAQLRRALPGHHRRPFAPSHGCAPPPAGHPRAACLPHGRKFWSCPKPTANLKVVVNNFVAISEGFALCSDTGCCYSGEPIAGEGRAVCRKYCFCLLTNSWDIRHLCTAPCTFLTHSLTGSLSVFFSSSCCSHAQVFSREGTLKGRAWSVCQLKLGHWALTRGIASFL